MGYFDVKNNNLWNKLYFKALLVSLGLVYIYFFSRCEIESGILVMIIPLLILAIIGLMQKPKIAFYVLFVYNYFAMGVNRYVPGPLGLGVDFLFLVIYLGLFIKCFRDDIGGYKAFNDLTFLAVLWFIYALLELENPNVVSREAWIYSMRGYSLYFLLTVPLVFILLDRRKYLDLFLKTWAIFTLIAVVKGAGQNYIGLDWAEQRWLNEGGALTHMIWSGLRIFSFFTDAGQFGSSMGHSGVVFSILAIGKKRKQEKIFFGMIAILAFWGMFLSGTRGAIAVPAAGFIFFVILVRNWKLLILGSTLLIVAFVFFKYTTIGQGNAQIMRMRTAFNPEDPSLQTRKNTTAIFKDYVKDKPFGTGIGSTGDWGRRFAPKSFTAELSADSWFLNIWIEQGIVGLVLHLSILLYCLVKGVWLEAAIRDKELAYIIKALLCGIVGILATSVGNKILGQMPTGLIFYMSIAFVFMSAKLQIELNNNIEK